SITAGLLTVTAPLLAHHSEAAQFDTTKPVKVTGTVKKVEWMNPHVWFYVDVKDDKGNITTWGFSGLPPGMLVRKGFTKDTLKPVADVKQLMHAIVIPSSNVVFHVEVEAPKDDNAWQLVVNNALAMAEAGNLLMIPGRAKNNDDWIKKAQALVDVGVLAMKAA